jgi:type IV fimbrial biogenesis protein FimT
MLVSRRPPLRRTTRGFTLIELVVTIAILGILIGLGLPSFREFIATQRLRNASFDLMASLMRTRSEAITHNGRVSMTKTTTTGNWDAGWAVIDNTAGTSTTVQAQQAFNGITITDSAGLSTITYGKDGRAVTGATSFTIAPSSTLAGVSSRCITIGLSGVPSSTTGGC